MSDILIKGMDMPKNCEKCIYSAWSNFYQIYVCNAVRKNEPVLFDGKQTKSTAVARSARADNCPLVEVPAHGRLIDADAVEKQIDYVANLDWNIKVGASGGMLAALGIVEDAPTVIEANENG